MCIRDRPFTEDTLLSAMEHAGQENYADDSEKKGLGTPVTRAATPTACKREAAVLTAALY